MNSTTERFPIFIILCLLFSCQKATEEKDIYSQYIEKASAFNSQEKYDNAFLYFNKAKLICKKEEKERKIYALLFLSEIQQKQNDFSGSEETITEALQVDSKSIYTPNLYNQLGIDSKELHNYENAIKYYNESYKSTSDSLYKLLIKNNIGVVYLESKKYKAAINTFSKLIDNPLLDKNPLDKASVLDNLGYAYFKNNNPEAITKLKQSLEIRIKENVSFNLISSYIHLYEYYANKDKDKSKEYAVLAYQNATKNNSIDDRIKSLKCLITISDGDDSKKYALQQIQLNDSIGNIRQKAKNQFAKIKYDSQLAINESKNQKNQKIIALLFLGIIVLIGFLLFVIIRRKNKEKLKTISYETKTRISKQLHDELANDVYHTLTFVETQNLENPEKKETLLNNLDNIYRRTRNISKENSTIDTSENYPEVLRDLISNYNSNDTKIIINNFTEINWQEINAEKKIII
jgi:tetratricopeptide (TPR) repeat protein